MTTKENSMQAAQQEKLIVVEEQPRQQSRTTLPTVAADASALMKIIDRAAMDPNFDVAKLQALLAVKKEWEADEARKAYNEAMAEFKTEAIEIIKRKQVDYANKAGGRTKYKHAELSDVVEAVGPALSKHGFSWSWTPKQSPGLIEVTCTLKHRLGHSETVTLGAPPDESGGKNTIQAIISTTTYLERHTLKAACGVSEKGDDNDGQGAGGNRMDENAYADHLSAIDAAADKAGLMKAFGAAWKAAEQVGDMRAMKKLGERKDARKKAMGIK